MHYGDERKYNVRNTKTGRMVFNPQGQSLVEDVGYVPLYPTMDNAREKGISEMNKFTGVLLLARRYWRDVSTGKGTITALGKREPWTDVSAGATCITLQR